MNFILLALTLFTTDAPPVELWGGINVGTSIDELLARYPKKRFQLTDECKVRLDPELDGTKAGLVKTLRLVGNGYNQCGALVRDGLRTKYGEPVSTTEQIVGVGEKIVNYRFETASLSISMNLAVNNPDGAIPFGNYDVVYSPRSAATAVATKL